MIWNSKVLWEVNLKFRFNITFHWLRGNAILLSSIYLLPVLYITNNWIRLERKWKYEQTKLNYLVVGIEFGWSGRSMDVPIVWARETEKCRQVTKHTYKVSRSAFVQITEEYNKLTVVARNFWPIYCTFQGAFLLSFYNFYRWFNLILLIKDTDYKNTLQVSTVS